MRCVCYSICEMRVSVLSGVCTVYGGILSNKSRRWSLGVALGVDVVYIVQKWKMLLHHTMVRGGLLSLYETENKGVL